MFCGGWESHTNGFHYHLCSARRSGRDRRFGSFLLGLLRISPESERNKKGVENWWISLVSFFLLIPKIWFFLRVRSTCSGYSIYLDVFLNRLLWISTIWDLIWLVSTVGLWRLLEMLLNEHLIPCHWHTVAIAVCLRDVLRHFGTRESLTINKVTDTCWKVLDVWKIKARCFWNKTSISVINQKHAFTSICFWFKAEIEAMRFAAWGAMRCMVVSVGK